MAAENSTGTPFRVIIAGGGPVGLTLAHALTAAGIDFVVLERYHTFNTANGASVALWPHNVRLLDQLGLLDSARAIYMPIHRKANLRPDGSVIEESAMLDAVEELHGHPWMCFRRGVLIEMLYDALPHKEKLLVSKQVEDVEITDSGVRVLCKDGSAVEGSVLVGADGVHSVVRGIMGRLSTAAGKPLDDQGSAFVTTFRGLYGYGEPLPEGVAPGFCFETRGKDVHFQLITNEAGFQFAAYMTLPEKKRGGVGGGNQSTKEDEEAAAASVAEHVVHPELKFKDLWQRKKWSFLDNIEEGRIGTWHYGGRIVLAGDAVHKMCPDIGLGLNTGMQEVCALTNGLRALLLPPTPTLPDAKALEAVFAAYQEERLKAAKKAGSLSSLVARVVGWASGPLEFTDRHVAKRLGGDVTIAKLVVAPFIQKGIVFDFLEERNLPVPKLKWITQPKIKPAAAPPPAATAALEQKVAA